jgi:hypothetical protein
MRMKCKGRRLAFERWGRYGRQPAPWRFLEAMRGQANRGSVVVRDNPMSESDNYVPDLGGAGSDRTDDDLVNLDVLRELREVCRRICTPPIWPPSSWRRMAWDPFLARY